MTAAVEVEELHRVFGSGGAAVPALRGVSFTAAAGSVVAVLGSNGAGKTTLTKILSTLLLPSGGRARVLGHDVVAEPYRVRAATGVVFGGDRGLYTRLSGRANLRFFGMLGGVSRRDLAGRVRDGLEQVGLTGAADRRVETYSRGMRQRLHIAIGTISRPSVLLLDEPTVGLDPTEAARLRASIADLRDSGTTVLLTSHYLRDIEELADRVVLLDGGTVASDLPLAEFVAEAGYAAVVELRTRGPAPDLARLPAGTVIVDSVAAVDGGHRVTMRLPGWRSDVLRHLSDLLGTVDVADLQVRPAGLEEAYARLSVRSAG